MYRPYRRLFQETSYKDIYAKAFQEFEKKWKKQKNDTDLYVQFTNHNDNTLGRSIYADPNHSDPAGVYGYPLKYVIDYPADIWYGNNASFLRVLRRTSGKYLNLQTMSYSDCVDLLQESGIRFKQTKPGFYNSSEAEDVLKAMKKLFSRVTGSNWYQKAFFSAIQMKIEDVEYSKKLESKDIKVRPGTEQSKILMSLGYDVIMDESKRSEKSAVINDREPEQVIFLRPTAFKVEEVFYMKQNKGEGVQASQTPENSQRKLVAMIFEKLGDKISEGGQYGRFWSKGGRRLEIEWLRPDAYYQNKKMGQKKHKEDKKFSSYYPKIRLYTEWGTIIQTFGQDQTFEEIAQEMYEAYESDKEEGTPPGFSETKAKYDADQEAEKSAYYKKQNEEKKQKSIDAWPELEENLKELSSLVGSPVDKIVAFAESSDDNKAEMHDFLDGFRNIAYRAYHKVESEFDENNPRPDYTKFKDMNEFRALESKLHKDKKQYIKDHLFANLSESMDTLFEHSLGTDEDTSNQIKQLFFKAIDKAGYPDSQSMGIYWLIRAIKEKDTE